MDRNVKISVIVSLLLMLLAILYLFTQLKTDTEPTVKSNPDSTVSFSEKCNNFRSLVFDNPIDLQESIHNLIQDLEDSKEKAANYHQDKEKLMSSITGHLYPLIESNCMKSEYNWDYIKCTLALMELVHKNRSFLVSGDVEKLDKYKASVQLYSKCIKLQKEKLDNLASAYNKSIHDLYTTTYNSYISDNLLSRNQKLSSDLSEWKDDFETWEELEKFLLNTDYNENTKHYELNDKYEKLKSNCERLNNDSEFAMYHYYRAEICNRTEEIKKVIENIVNSSEVAK